MHTISNLDTAKTTATQLLQVGAVQLRPLQPFKWTSGWLSPIYCDNRLTLSHPSLRTYIKQQLSTLVRDQFPHAQIIAGVATAGIPQGALVADLLGMPFIYVRSEAKGHGMENQIEGRLNQHDKVVVIEDLISTGSSSLKAVNALKKAGANVLGVVAVFTYGFDKATESFREAGLACCALTDYNNLINVASEKGYIVPEQIDTLHDWRANPGQWGAEQQSPEEANS